VESARRQNLPGLEILVVDNCSTDGTWERLQNLQDPHLRLERNQANLGLFGNFNRCLELARGKFLRFLCSDDLLWPDCLAGEIALMERHPAVAMLSTRGWMTDINLNRKGKMGDYLAPGIYRGVDAIPAALWILVNYGSPFNFPSGVLLRTREARQAGGFDTSLNHLGDLDFWFRVLRHGDFAVSGGVGCEVRNHTGQESSRLLLSGKYVDEWFLLVKRWSGELHRHRLYDHVLHQVAATSLRIALHFFRRGRSSVARQYLRAALEQVPSRRALLFASFRLLALTVLARTCNFRLNPPNFFRPRILLT
jgi:glycosyltransferase involved in cell wall biosynthesis